MTRDYSIVPRNGETLKALTVARISGCQHQKEMSLEDQAEHAREELRELYDGPIEIHQIATKAKGERLDRPELKEIEQRLRQGGDDVMLMEDVGRLIRGTDAVRLWGMAVDNGIRCIAPNDGCDTVEATWEEDLIAACKDHVSHCAHTSLRIKHKQMRRFKRHGGAVPLPIYGYIKPDGAKRYSEWLKDETATPFLHEGLEVLRQTASWTAVADYFNRHSVPTGPYCHNERWNGAMVSRLYHNPLLKGMPQRGKRHTKKHYGTGRRVCFENPAGPTYRDEPHLAHFDPDELDSVISVVDEKHMHRGRKYPEGPGANIGNGKRSLFPGRCAVCYYCGRQLVWGANGAGKNLMCNGARHYQCWHSLGVDGPLTTNKVVDAIIRKLVQLEGFDEQFSQLVQSARSAVGADETARRSLEADEAQLQREKENVFRSVRLSGMHPMLDELLEKLTEQENALKRRRRELENRNTSPPDLPDSPRELRLQFEKLAQELAQNSYEFADVLRSLVTGLHVYRVRLIDGDQLVPRAKLKLSLGGIVRDIEKAPTVQESLTRELTLDLFTPPTRVLIREDAVKYRRDGMYQRAIAMKLDTHQATVQQAIKLHELMLDQGLTSPYVPVIDCPTDVRKLRLKRCLNEKYHFEPLKGYQRPKIE